MKKIISLLLSAMMLVSLCTVVLAEGEVERYIERYNVVFSETEGITITANDGYSLEDIDRIQFFGGIPLSKGVEYSISDNKITISTILVKRMIDSNAKETSVGSSTYTLLLLKNVRGDTYGVFQTNRIYIDPSFMLVQIDSDKVTFQETIRYNYKHYEIKVTDMDLVELNPNYVKVYFGEKFFVFSYDRENSTDDYAIYYQSDHSIKSHITYGTYNPKLSATGYHDYTFGQSITTGSKPNNLSSSYNETDGELEIDFSACSEDDRSLMMDIMLINFDDYNTKYPDLKGYYFTINQLDVRNKKEYGDNQPIYKKSETVLAVRGWMIDLAKNTEESKDRNSGRLQLPGYTNYQIGHFKVESTSLPQGFDAKVTYEKDEVYLDVECVTSEVLSKVDSLQYYLKLYAGRGDSMVMMYISKESLTQLEARGVLTKSNDHSFRVRISSKIDQRFNGYHGFLILNTGIYGEMFNLAVQTVVAPKVGDIDSNACTLNDITLADGWPNITTPTYYNDIKDTWHWVNPSETISAGETSKHWAEIQVWDYKGSTHLYNSNEYVDYEAICSKLDNVKYVVEGDNHYLRAEVIVPVPQSADAGIKTSVTNLNPTEDLSAAIRADVDIIQSIMTANGLTEIAYYDIKLNDGAITEIDNEAQIKLALPEWVQKEPVASDCQRVYSVITVHDGAVRTIEATDNGDGTITFGSDKFSIFTLTYKDVPLSSAGSPGSTSPGSTPGSGSGSSGSVSTITRKPVVNTSAK